MRNVDMREVWGRVMREVESSSARTRDNSTGAVGLILKEGIDKIVDEVVASALIAKLGLEAVGEERKEVVFECSRLSRNYSCLSENFSNVIFRMPIGLIARSIHINDMSRGWKILDLHKDGYKFNLLQCR